MFPIDDRRGYRRPCKRRRQMLGFVQPCLLILLSRSDIHGYQLFQRLAAFGFDPHLTDPSVIYHVLRTMEVEGWVTSYQGTESQGPQRRIYQLTASGRASLDAWIEDLRLTRRKIDALIGAYDDLSQTLSMEEKSENSSDL